MPDIVIAPEEKPSTESEYDNSDLYDNNDTTHISTGGGNGHNGSTGNGNNIGNSSDSNNGQKPTTISDGQLLVNAAMKYLGYSEKENWNTIIGWLHTAGVAKPNKDHGWCASFLYCMFLEAGLSDKLGDFKSARVCDWTENYGYEVDIPQVGDLAIFKFSHIGIVKEVIKTSTGYNVVIIAGNNSNDMVGLTGELSLSFFKCFKRWP